MRPFQKYVVLGTALAISWIFYKVVSPFLMAVLMAAILAGMLRPTYLWITEKLGGRYRLGSAITVLLLVVLVVIPAFFLVGALVSQAVSISDSVTPWVESRISEVDQLEAWLQGLPGVGEFVPSPDELLAKLGEFATTVGGFLVGSLAAATRGTARFFLELFVSLYALFFFLIAGPEMLKRIMYLFPLETEQEERLLSKFSSVARATIKGTLVIGLVQGGLAALGFLVVGIEGTVFWGTIMVVLSIIPVIGAAVIWIPAVLYLFSTGSVTAGVLLLIWCGVVVSGTDNVLRPILVGRDTKMPDLMVLLSTLGGLSVFGVVGFIVGPIIAALFLTIWDIYGTAFTDNLPSYPGVPPEFVPVEPVPEESG
jgi:predicted PurR-regulated permease PerM